jgi:hypothetical protein
MENLSGLDFVSWEIMMPLPDPALLQDDWLREVREMRGWALYENGRRPYLKKSDDLFWDEDNFDPFCYHILARIDGKIVGCVRLLPLTNNLNCVTHETVGTQDFLSAIQSLCAQYSLETHEISEASRWIVDPNYQQTKIGYYLGYAAWALANHLGYLFFANGGFKINKLLQHYGGVYLPKNAGPYYSEKYQDDIYILSFDKSRLSTKAIDNIEKMRKILKLPSRTPAEIFESQQTVSVV